MDHKNRQQMTAPSNRLLVTEGRTKAHKSRRRIAASLLLSFGLMFLTTGCHCLPITERYCDRVDCVADHEACLDRWYCPKLDVTRWGMWNGPDCCR